MTYFNSGEAGEIHSILFVHAKTSLSMSLTVCHAMSMPDFQGTCLGLIRSQVMTFLCSLQTDHTYSVSAIP
ncbi:hypothetical protein AMECASPLE_015912 [Ameca splendens]|uniref:Uncharacterized protein n=1 Tax=Ameca splendens TaxID=208324 RepID=A0ABV0ZBS2_9TELE